MFLKLHTFGETIFVNMDHVFDFHADIVKGIPEHEGTLLHFTTDVQPYGNEKGTHWKKHVDESPDQIFETLAGNRA